MLIEFSVSNFRSIKDEQCISFLPSGRVSNTIHDFLLHHDHYPKTETLPSVVIYGANASGKSNLLRALELLTHMVKEGHQQVPGQDIKTYSPFRLDRYSRELPTHFEIRFISSDGIQYEYALSYDMHQITYEALFAYPSNRRVRYFERHEGVDIVFGKHFRGEKKSVERHTLPNQLFLSKGAENNLHPLTDIYLYFTQNLRTYIMLRTLYDDQLIKSIAKFMGENPQSNFAYNLNQLVSRADTGIKRIYAEKDPIEGNSPYENSHYRIKSVHILEGEPEQEVVFDLQEESVGTKKLISLGGLIMRSLEKGDVLVIDEMDKSLHPHLTRALIKLFHHEESNPNGAQLLFATHDVSLLQTYIFRQDQIYFSEKDMEGATELSSLSDIPNLKKDLPLNEWYMSGKFGGTPLIDEQALDFKFKN